jgi:GTPase SAR1 family protein
MDASEEFTSYKKVIIFGNEGSGKTSLTKRIERGSFTNESHTENCKLKIYNSAL